MKIDCHAQSFHAIVGPTNVLMVSRLLLLPVWSIRLRQMPIGAARGHCRLVNQRAARLGRAGIARWPLAGFMQPIIAKPKMKRPRQLWPDGCGCKSCGTRRRDHKFLGYCTRCHPIIYRISRIDRGLYHPRGREPYSDSFLAGIRKSAVAELEEIGEFEAPVRDGATGIDIENLLVAIARHTRVKPEKLDGVRHFFDGCLNVEQRTRPMEY